MSSLTKQFLTPSLRGGGGEFYKIFNDLSLIFKQKFVLLNWIREDEQRTLKPLYAACICIAHPQGVKVAFFNGWYWRHTDNENSFSFLLFFNALSWACKKWHLDLKRVMCSAMQSKCNSMRHSHLSMFSITLFSIHLQFHNQMFILWECPHKYLPINVSAIVRWNEHPVVKFCPHDWTSSFAERALFLKQVHSVHEPIFNHLSPRGFWNKTLSKNFQAVQQYLLFLN